MEVNPQKLKSKTGDTWNIKTFSINTKERGKEEQKRRGK